MLDGATVAKLLEDLARIILEDPSVESFENIVRDLSFCTATRYLMFGVL